MKERKGSEDKVASTARSNAAAQEEKLEPVEGEEEHLSEKILYNSGKQLLKRISLLNSNVICFTAGWPGLQSQIPPSWIIFTAKFRPT